MFLNGARGIPVVKAVQESRHAVTAVVVPSKQKCDPIQDEVQKIGLDCLRLENVNSTEAIAHLQSLLPELFIIAGFSTIFKEELINIPRMGVINLHAGRLPEYRGGSPLNWQIINGESEAVISVIKIDQGIDTGPVLSEQAIKIEPSDTIADLHGQANKLFPGLVLDAIERIETETNPGRIQDEDNAMYWHQRSDRDGYLDFSRFTAKQADRFIRALTRPYPGAWAFLDQKKVRLLAAEIPKMDLRGSSGRICFIQGQGPYVVCKDRALLLKEYLIEETPNSSLKHGQYLS
nr:methionyl-tRNA formyltransferase [Desulfonatronovibrio magnus]